ncbi:MAG: hypothetical protein ACTTI6_09360 [Treponema sp.]|uniref:hypothetical protein n=1 Tax=Treponema sp. TaxID=166 RepID=UPI003FA2F6BB
MTNEQLMEIDKSDLLTDYLAQLEENACAIVALGKGKQTNVQTVIYVADDGSDAVIAVYDFRYHTWKSTDTFDKLAADLLGNPNYGTMLAYFNGVVNESELEAGAKVKIPVLQAEESNTGNVIYAAPEKQENYGVDMTLTDNGDFAVSSDDFAEVSGCDNLKQAITLRLTTASQKRIRIAAYGIRSTIGEPMAVQSYLTCSIEQTMKADPRISEVEEITFRGDGDVLRLTVVYTDINGEAGTYKGEL